MKRLRFVGLVFVVLSILAEGSAQAAAPLKYTDKPGDTLDGRASMDIVSVTHDLRQVNKTGPPSIVFELELAAPPESQLASYYVFSVIEGCGDFYASFRPGSLVFGNLGIAPADFWIDCGADGGDILPGQFRIDGKILRWAIALDGLPKDVRAGQKVGELHALTQIAEPATGIIGTGWLDGRSAPLPVDAASTDKTWGY